MLRRFGLGASEAEVEFYGRNGLAGAIDLLVDYEQIDNPWDLDPAVFGNRQGAVNIRVMQGIWGIRLLTTRRPLEEKMTLFWHSHFATSAQKVDNSYVMMHHVEILRAKATSKFYDLLLGISQDPAMMFWLDNQINVVGRPNENFAREVMELFTLGIGHYSEEDVQEAARAFTGWGYGFMRAGRPVLNEDAPRRFEQFLFDPARHDNKSKTVLNKRGNLTGEQVLKLLCEHPQTALFLTKKIWEFFVYPNPSAATLAPHVQRFRDSNLDIKVLLKSIMRDEEFYGPKAHRKLVKNPVDFAVTTARQLGVGGPLYTRAIEAVARPEINPDNGLNGALLRAASPAFAIIQSTKAMGMELLYPPDVSGWHPGDDWITTSTMLERIKWAEKLYLTAVGREPRNAGTQRTPIVGANVARWLAPDGRPETAVDSLLSVFDAAVDAKTRDQLVITARNASGGRVSVANANATAEAISKLLFAAPSFQYA